MTFIIFSLLHKSYNSRQVSLTLVLTLPSLPKRAGMYFGILIFWSHYFSLILFLACSRKIKSFETFQSFKSSHWGQKVQSKKKKKQEDVINIEKGDWKVVCLSQQLLQRKWRICTCIWQSIWSVNNAWYFSKIEWILCWLGLKDFADIV